jgi:uncharacterized membrane protein
MTTRADVRAATALPPLAQAAVDLENDERLDPAVETLGRLTRPLAEGATGDALRGSWLGHALHPLLTDLPLGLWTAASALDVLGGEQARPAARRLVGLGLLAVAPTAASGWAEWHRTGRREQRVGVAHAALNVAGVAVYAGSWGARRAGRDRLGAALALTGAGLTGLGGYLGGHLTSVRKVSSRHPAFDTADGHGAFGGSAASTAVGPGAPDPRGTIMNPSDPASRTYTSDDVVAALTGQHARITAMVERLAGPVRSGDTTGLSELFGYLAVHQAIEDELIAPLTAGSPSSPTGLERPGEPDGMELQIANLQQLTPGQPGHKSQFAALEDSIEHHMGLDEVEEVTLAVRGLDDASATRIVRAMTALEATAGQHEGRFSHSLAEARADLRRILAEDR